VAVVGDVAKKSQKAATALDLVWSRFTSVDADACARRKKSSATLRTSGVRLAQSRGVTASLGSSKQVCTRCTKNSASLAGAAGHDWQAGALKTERRCAVATAKGAESRSGGLNKVTAFLVGQ
jgi:hypothetical protein